MKARTSVKAAKKGKKKSHRAVKGNRETCSLKLSSISPRGCGVSRSDWDESFYCQCCVRCHLRDVKSRTNSPREKRVVNGSSNSINVFSALGLGWVLLRHAGAKMIRMPDLSLVPTDGHRNNRMTKQEVTSSPMGNHRVKQLRVRHLPVGAIWIQGSGLNSGNFGLIDGHKQVS